MRGVLAVPANRSGKILGWWEEGYEVIREGKVVEMVYGQGPWDLTIEEFLARERCEYDYVWIDGVMHWWRAATGWEPPLPAAARAPAPEPA